MLDVVEINGGRVYLRPLHDDARISDRAALRQLGKDPTAFFEHARHSSTDYYWAICEQTNVAMIALALYDGTQIHTYPIGDPNRILPNDPVLSRLTVAQAAEQGHAVLQRYLAQQPRT
ncbi:hypothetical protein [Corynebacterium sp. HS2168-gen11]|uniref:hypothetical protein n=1 Tax=Corynebacterium sp. HS2168-gen11 TaxID=2974027 RepID=UPI00216AC89B|nr:hypothetical protein [Corynebacterium sp. HS2168-gen11]MCS4535873.1 hypothetical protein [Corynebacterium sp. HS2168-gen11]